MILLDAQRECCFELGIAVGPGACEDGHNRIGFEQAIVAMFLKEWQLQGREGQLETIAIIDEKPQEQYLRPEFDW